MISPTVENRMRAALATLTSEADRLATAVAASSGLTDKAWQFLTSTESTASAAAETARQARKAADEMQTRFVSLVSDPDATDEQGETFVSDANARAGISASLAAAEQTTPGGAAREVASQSTADVLRAAEKVGAKLGEWSAPLIGAVLIAAVLGLYAYGRGRAG